MTPRLNRLAAVFIVLAAAACTDQQPLTAPSSASVTQPSIVDGTDVVEGSENFFFLTPIAQRDPERTIANDPDLLEALSIEICAWDGTACTAPADYVLRADMPLGRGGISAEGEDGEPGYFISLWRTPIVSGDAPAMYRLVVKAGTVVMGYADVVLLDDASQASAYDPTEFVTVVEGGTLPIRFRVRQDIIAGDPAAPVATEVPQETFVPRLEDYTTDHPTLPGVGISHNTILLSFDPATTVGQANEVLDLVDGDVVGAIPSPDASLPAILFVRLPTPDHSALIEVLEGLRADPAVLGAVQDGLLGTTLTTAPDASVSWFWGLPAAGGNWGMEWSRVPQMWNLNPGIEKRAGGSPTGTAVGVVDVGFADPGEHPDLAYDENLTPGVRAEHGTHVAGTIGATWGNGVGVDGLDPWVRLVVSGPEFTSGQDVDDDFDLRSSWGSEMLQGYLALLTARPDVRVVNMSLGFNWAQAGIDSDTNTEAQELVDESGIFFQFGQALAESRGDDLPVLVVAAGNDAGKDARYSSPMTNAALVGGEANIVVVEAFDESNNLTGFSNVGGHISAPGNNILSTIIPSTYGTKNGTSMASPHVAGLISYLYTVRSGLPRPTRSTNPVLDLLLANARDDVGMGGSPRIDAFATAMDVDRIEGSDRLLRMLLDLDDGTRDGNRRTDLSGIGDYLLEDADGDGGPGDGVIDISDFRRWRDWYLRLRSDYAELDGSADHPKKDANGDGLVQSGFEGNYPRGDFNGDGSMDLNGRSAMPGALGGQSLTDLEVLQSRYSDPDYAASELDELVFSADFWVNAATCFDAAPVSGSVRTTVTGSGSDEGSSSSFGWFQSRQHDASLPAEIFTGRVGEAPDPTTVTVRTDVVNGSGEVIASAERNFDVWPGSDRRWTPDCESTAPPTTGFAYVASQGEGTVTAIDLSDGSIETTISVGTFPFGVAVYPDGSEVWVGNRGDGSISVIETTGHTVLTTLAQVAGDPIDIAFSPDGTEAYVVDNDAARIVVFDATTRKEIAVIDGLAGFPRALTVSPDGARGYVAAGTGVDVVDLAGRTRLTTIAGTGSPVDLHITEDGRRVVVPDADLDVVRLIDTSTLSVTATIFVGADPTGVAGLPGTTRVLVANEGSNDVSIVDSGSGLEVGRFAVASGPYFLAVTPDGRWAAVGQRDGGSLALVDLLDNSVSSTLPVGDFPAGVGVVPGG